MVGNRSRNNRNMKYILLLVFLTCVVDGQVANLKAFSWDASCGQGNPITVVDLSVTPDPIMLPGEVYLNISVISTESIVDAPGTKLEFVVERAMDGVVVTQPCFESFYLGSCTYDLCPTLEERHPNGCTQQQIDMGMPCSCSQMVAGEYNIENYFILYPTHPPGQLFNGDYHAHVTLTSDHQLLCLDIYFSVLVLLH